MSHSTSEYVIYQKTTNIIDYVFNNLYGFMMSMLINNVT